MSSVKQTLEKRKSQFYDFILQMTEKYKADKALCDYIYDSNVDQFIFAFKSQIIPLNNNDRVVQELLKKASLQIEDIEEADISKFNKYIELFCKFIKNL